MGGGGTGGGGKGARLRGTGMVAVVVVEALLKVGGGGQGAGCKRPPSEGTTSAKRHRRWARIRARDSETGLGGALVVDVGGERGRLTRSSRGAGAALGRQRRHRRREGGGAGPRLGALHKG